MNRKRWFGLCVVAVALTACGGSGGAGTSPFGSGSGSGSGGTTGSNSGTVTSNTAGSLVLSLSNSTVSASQPATVTAVVKNAAGSPVAGALVTFALSGASSSVGTLSVASALTDSRGEAATTLTPANGATSGAAYVTASADTSGGALTSKVGFSVSATNVTLTSVAASPSTVSAYGSSAINIAVSGASTSAPVTVTVSSTCAVSGKAIISPSTLTLTSATGSVTYQDKACSATDRINVQIAGSGQQTSTDLIVQAPTTQAIQYVSVDNPTICLIGTGCPSRANVKFKVVDTSGLGVPGATVNFALNSTVQAFANLGTSSGTTNASGEVEVSVSSLSTPTPLRVTATVNGSSPSISTVSNLLTISGGLPKAGLTGSTTGMSFAAEKYALNGNLDGDKSELILRLTDRWGQPAIDGTAVTLVTDGGTVVPASCVTTSGECKVKFQVSNPRPNNGRVHVVAYAAAQEYFVDGSNGGTINGQVDGSETYDDVQSAVCLDTNENDLCDTGSGEFVVGSSSSPNAGNGSWDNAGTVFARLQRLFFFSQQNVTPRLYKSSSGVCTSTPVDDAYMTVSMGNTVQRKSISFCVRDGNTAADTLGGNPIMSGSTLAVDGTIVKVSASIENPTVPEAVNGPTLHTVVISNTSSPLATLPGSGSLDIKITTGGRVFTSTVPITVNP